ncbi:hypothetical protein AGMMS49579_17820 [Spirochaetia bacterium]|nr:hypothetical protein AGMMS49579_17820 [Spirochaetia bacterium]
MKKLSVSKALIGLFVVLAVGMAFTACEIGTYDWDDGTTKYSIELGSDGKATYYEITVTSETMREGTYGVSGGLIVITWTKETVDGAVTPNYKENTDVYRRVGNALYKENGSSAFTKSVDNEAIELELDLSAEELEALGL